MAKKTLVYVGVVLPWAGEQARTGHDVYVAETEDGIIEKLMSLNLGFRQKGSEFYRPDLYAASGEVVGAFYCIREM